MCKFKCDFDLIFVANYFNSHTNRDNCLFYNKRSYKTLEVFREMISPTGVDSRKPKFSEVVGNFLLFKKAFDLHIWLSMTLNLRQQSPGPIKSLR